MNRRDYAGIINIVLKENTNVGLNGSYSATAANNDKYNGSANFNMRKDNSIFGNCITEQITIFQIHHQT